MVCNGNVWGILFKIIKGVILEMGGLVLEIVYLIEGLLIDWEFYFGVEFNFVGLLLGVDDCYFYFGDGLWYG